jgi:hypothetical protein
MFFYHNFSSVARKLDTNLNSTTNWISEKLKREFPSFKQEKKQRIQNPLKLFELFKIKCSHLQGHRIITFVNELTFMKYLI